MFESQDRGQGQNMTDKRFFWLALYCQPALWVVLGVLALVRLKNPIWLILIGELGVCFFFVRAGEEETRRAGREKGEGLGGGAGVRG